jgi:carbon-monoxide dehydrogenase medium subunit/xanthine dehydrogenase FAD-binding subunit
MIPNISYIRPLSLSGALETLSRSTGEIKALAGGTDIIPGLQQNSARFREIKCVVDISGLPELSGIRLQDDRLQIGAAVTFSLIKSDQLIRRHFPLLCEMSGKIGSEQIRNRATIGGNFINNAPCADSVPVLLVYNAAVHLRSWNAQREMPLEEFLLKPYSTRLQPQELVTHISLPLLPQSFKGEFYKLGRRRAVNISRISLAMLLDQHEQTIRELRLAGGAVTPIGQRFHEIEMQAAGQNINDRRLREIAIQTGAQALEITGLRWSSEYKLPVLQQVFYQILYRLCDLRPEK